MIIIEGKDCYKYKIEFNNNKGNTFREYIETLKNTKKTLIKSLLFT